MARANEPFIAIKGYDEAAFILNDRKLMRVIEVARERLERVKGNHAIAEAYEVRFRDRKGLRLGSVDNILSLDNSVKNPIVLINIDLQVNAPEEKLPRHALRISFDARDDEEHVYLHGHSSDLAWLNETTDSLEEQLDRTIAVGLPYLIKRRLALFSAVVLLAVASITTGYASFMHGNRLYLPAKESEALLLIAKSAKTDSERLDFVAQYLAATLEQPSSRSIHVDTRTYFVAVPLLVTFASVVAAILWFYPRNVFVWGDIAESYERVTERRKFLWYGVVASLVIGVLGNLFVIGATGVG